MGLWCDSGATPGSSANEWGWKGTGRVKVPGVGPSFTEGTVLYKLSSLQTSAENSGVPQATLTPTSWLCLGFPQPLSGLIVTEKTHDYGFITARGQKLVALREVCMGPKWKTPP